MTTFTLRVSDVMAARLNSAEIRTWLDAFLRDPHDILGDPGPGRARVSLTLPEPEVKAVAAHLQCTSSSALRRLAGEYLGTASPMTPSVPDMISPGRAVPKRIRPQSPARSRRTPLPSGTTEPNFEQDNKIRLQGGEVLVVGLLILVFLSVMSWVLFISPKEEGTKPIKQQDAQHNATNE
jgi:hypothetical protein